MTNLIAYWRDELTFPYQGDYGILSDCQSIITLLRELVI